MSSWRRNSVQDLLLPTEIMIPVQYLACVALILSLLVVTIWAKGAKVRPKKMKDSSRTRDRYRANSGAHTSTGDGSSYLGKFLQPLT
ncbi:hypothetical protein LSH36_677g01024 [Paralvinella palmiformis]|uniref:Uncharacterized protein n=1 Tax=Paralvinella palmiformis TaxID=53620 RepID=A0AAD9J3U2_9ANNE|nr:hypothetical protein LSH36_677g01024 [Paralvinella palmiformis]